MRPWGGSIGGKSDFVGAFSIGTGDAVKSPEFPAEISVEFFLLGMAVFIQGKMVHEKGGIKRIFLDQMQGLVGCQAQAVGALEIVKRHLLDAGALGGEDGGDEKSLFRRRLFVCFAQGVGLGGDFLVREKNPLEKL